jgi:hypothetical protein
MLDTLIKKDIVEQYRSIGKERFYQSLLAHGNAKSMLMQKGQYDGVSPEIEMMEGYDKFLILYREDDEEAFLEIANLMRRAGHIIYRNLLNKKLTSVNDRFLNRVI